MLSSFFFKVCPYYLFPVFNVHRTDYTNMMNFYNWQMLFFLVHHSKIYFDFVHLFKIKQYITLNKNLGFCETAYNTKQIHFLNFYSYPITIYFQLCSATNVNVYLAQVIPYLPKCPKVKKILLARRVLLGFNFNN